MKPRNVEMVWWVAVFLSAGVFGAGAASILTPSARIGQRIVDLDQAAVTVTDLEDGVALTFTARSGELPQLRRSIEQMAAVFDTEAAPGAPHDPPGGVVEQNVMLPAVATVEPLVGGARLTLKPADPSDLTALRIQVRHMVN